MAVTGVATADYNTVCSALERAQNKHRVNTAGTRHSYDLYVGRICKTVISRKIRACV